MKILFCILLFLFTYTALAEDTIAYKTLQGYAVADKEALGYNYVFDFSYASMNLLLSSYGLSRFSKHQDEISVIYAANAIINFLHLYRTYSIVGENGLFHEAYEKVKKENNVKLREMISEYKLMEISNSVRQLRRITAYWGLISSGFMAAFAEGKKIELASSLFLFSNSVFYLLFYSSYGEDAYDKYFFYKKAYPEISFKKEAVTLTMNFIF